jgi:pilus assembly protein CpaF
VTEVLRMESDVITLQDVFIAKPPDESSASYGSRNRLMSPLRCTGLKPQFLEKLAANGVGLHASFFMPEEEIGPGVRDTQDTPTFGGYE